MPIDFPNSPSNGDIFTSGSSSWTYNTIKGVWDARPRVSA